jgi:hypothetical protein
MDSRIKSDALAAATVIEKSSFPFPLGRRVLSHPVPLPSREGVRVRFLLIIRNLRKERCATSETGTGFACAKLSEVTPPVAFAPVVGMTHKERSCPEARSQVLPLALRASSE